MLPRATVALPPSLMGVLERFRPCFTAPSFETFCMLMAGFIACAGTRTVCGMLSGAGLARVWPHDRAHTFFSRRRWSAEELGLTLAQMVVDLLVVEGEPVLVAVDGTLFRRRGTKVWAASWFHDGSAPQAHATGYGNNWVIVAIVVHLPFMTRPVALPVLAGLVKKDTVSASRLEVARRLVLAPAEALPGRRIDVVGDAAYVGKVLTTLPARVSWTSRLRKDAALYALPPASVPGRRGRRRLKGARLPSPAQLAAGLTFTDVTVRRYRRTEVVRAASLTCLWYGVFGPRPVQVVLVQAPSGALELALVSTDTSATPAAIIERYAARWSIESAILDAKQAFGVGAPWCKLRSIRTRRIAETVEGTDGGIVRCGGPDAFVAGLVALVEGTQLAGIIGDGGVVGKRRLKVLR
jgi:hypothetical protein